MEVKRTPSHARTERSTRQNAFLRYLVEGEGGFGAVLVVQLTL